MIKFLIDSGSDCNKEQLQEKGIEYIPIAISIGDKSFRDGEISKDEFYKLTQESEEFLKQRSHHRRILLIYLKKLRQMETNLYVFYFHQV